MAGALVLLPPGRLSGSGESRSAMTWSKPPGDRRGGGIMSSADSVQATALPEPSPRGSHQSLAHGIECGIVASMGEIHDSSPASVRRIRNITELAQLAGVSAGTVSRALAGNSLVNARTRTRIEALAREHDFRPNQMASRLRMKRTGLVGVVIPLGHERHQHVSDPFFMAMLGKMADVITESGNDLLLSRVIPTTASWLTDIVDSGLLDGVLLIGQSDQYDVIERVAQRYAPLVAWGHNRPGQTHCSVGMDNFAAGKLAAAHLVRRGARRLAFLGDLHGPEIAARCDGFAAGAAQAGLQVTLLPMHLAADDMEADITHQSDLMAAKFDGVLAASDMIAMRTLRALTDRSVDIPGQVAVIGFDDLELASHTIPRLSTIRQEIAQGAATMIEMLFRRINGEDTESVVMPPKLILRDSA